MLDGQRTPTRAEDRYVTAITGGGVHEGRLLVKPPPPAPADATVIEQRLSAGAAPFGIVARSTDTSPAGLEVDVVKDGLVRIASVTEEGLAHDGGGTNADALHNGTTMNGAGEDATLNDGRTFRAMAPAASLPFSSPGARS